MLRWVPAGRRSAAGEKGGGVRAEVAALAPSVARACHRRVKCRPSRSCLVRVISAVRAVQLLVPALALPLPVLQSRACQSESILGRPYVPARVDSAAYPAVLGLQVQVWAQLWLAQSAYQ